MSPYPNALLFPQLLPTSAAAFHTHKRRPHGHWESRMLSAIRDCNPCALWMHGWRVHTLHPKPRFFRAVPMAMTMLPAVFPCFSQGNQEASRMPPASFWLPGVNEARVGYGCLWIRRENSDNGGTTEASNSPLSVALRVQSRQVIMRATAS